MEFNNKAWDEVFRTEGRVFNEPIPNFGEITAEFTRNGCRHILDLGCGTGRHLVALKQSGFDIVGIDIAMNGLKQTREWLAEKNLTAGLACADTRRFFPFPSSCFDGLISTQVIHHALLEQVRLTISEIYRVLSHGAVAFISVAGRKPDEELSGFEVEPGTVVPSEGREKGLPHHLFTEEEARIEFGFFHIQKIGFLEGSSMLGMWLKKE